MSSFVEYKHFVICVGGREDEGDDGKWQLSDRIYIFNMKTLQWHMLNNIKLPIKMWDNSSIVTVNPVNGDVVLNLIGGQIQNDMRFTEFLNIHRKLYLGIDDKVRCKIWNLLKNNDTLSMDVWIIVFDMIDDGMFCQYDKPYFAANDTVQMIDQLI